MTLAEVLLWKRLNRRQLGVRFSRQKPIGRWVVDFYCKELMLAIEVDGQSHNVKEEDDKERQQQLESMGIRFLRFWDCEIKDNLQVVIEQIQDWIRENPPLEGEPTPACGHPSLGGESVELDIPALRGESAELEISSRGEESVELDIPALGEESAELEISSRGEESVELDIPSRGEESAELEIPSRGGESAELNIPSLGEEPAELNIPSCGGVREARGGSLNSPPLEGCAKRGVGCPTISHSNNPPIHPKKSGVALIVVMWVLIIVSLIVSSFAFEMKLEANIITAQRKRFQADQLARAGIELAKAMIAFKEDPLEGDDVIYDDPFLAQGAQIDKGVPVTYSEELGKGTVTIKIDFEKGRRSIRKLNKDGWHELFAQTGIPSVDWDELYGCLVDWQDESDTAKLNGAESDDPFYRDRGYECKNAPVDTVDELLLIKGWTEDVVYGTPADKIDETEYPLSGLAQHLTIWGEGKVNPNSATPEVLRSLYLSDQMIEAILEMRLGPDGEAGTEDDGLTQEDFGALGLDGALFTLQPEYATVSAEGEVGGTVSKISAVFKLGEKQVTPLFWLEER